MSERLKFLLSALNLKIGPFARTMGVSTTNVRNYLDRGSKPSSDFLESLVRNFDTINPAWLLTGEGEPFISTSPTLAPEIDASQTTAKIFSPTQVIKGKHNTQHQATGPAAGELAAAQQLIEQLRSQLADKERMIQLLLTTHQPK